MKKYYFVLLSMITSLSILAQTPKKISYQAVIRNASQELVKEHDVGVKIDVLKGSTAESATSVYSETHNSSTNKNGLLSIEIGAGDVISGNMSSISWGTDKYFVKVQTDPDGGSNYTIEGISQLLSVPYALYAQDVANKDDADANPSNELQILNFDNATGELTISDGNTVTIPAGSGGDNWGSQTVKSDNTLSGEGTSSKPLKVDVTKIKPKWSNIQSIPSGFADNQDNVDDADHDPNNEMQTLSLSGQTLTITNGNSVTLPTGGGSNPAGSTGSIQFNKNNSFGASTDLFWKDGNKSLGIGTNAPKAMLHVAKNSSNRGNVVFTGEYKEYSPGAPPVSGAGTRMIWYPDKAAFRAGRVEGTQWNGTNIGKHSVAMGKNTKASGSYSTAMGWETKASGQASTAMGYQTTASGGGSIAMGRGTTASKPHTTAMGYQTTASGESSVAMGSITKASGQASTAMGQETEASGLNSVAMGEASVASGKNSIAMGDRTKASVSTAIAIGSHTTASGEYGSIAMGYQTKASGKSSTSMGNNTKALKDYSTAMGNNTTASGLNSTAIGNATTASGINSIAMGFETLASAERSTAMGWKSEAKAPNSVAMGFQAKALGATCTAMGYQTKAEGLVSTTMGKGTIAKALLETVIGQFNYAPSSYSTNQWVKNQPIFVIGIGSSDSNRKNAMTVLKSGNVGLGSITNPTYALQLPNNNSSGKARATSWTTYSDRRVKSNIKSIDYGLSEIMKMKPVSYFHHDSDIEDNAINVLDSGKEDIGFIAQEVYKIVPEIVSKPQDDTTELWGMTYEKLVPVLVKAMQEQQKTIDSLLKRVEELEKK